MKTRLLLTLAILATSLSASMIPFKRPGLPAPIVRIEPCEAIDTLIERYEATIKACQAVQVYAPDDIAWQRYLMGRIDGYKQANRDLLTLRQLIKQGSR